MARATMRTTSQEPAVGGKAGRAAAGPVEPLAGITRCRVSTPGCFTCRVAIARVHIEEWHFGDDGWVFDQGSAVRIYCDVLDADELGRLLELWDEESLRD